MTTLAQYFSGHIICINRSARKDRWDNCVAQAKKFDFPIIRYEAHDMAQCLVGGQPNGNMACTASHRGVLELILHHGWKRTLVLEDDFQIVDEAFPEMFDSMISEVPDDWDFLFLGAGYAEPPIARINGSVIRAGRLLTTSSYGITYDMARRIAPYVSGVGPIDSLYGGWQREFKTYILSPRLMVQADGWSDLANNFSRNSNSMLDRAHEEMV